MSSQQQIGTNLESDQSTRSTDPNVLQQRASDPQSSVWVGASAGSGKTKVLTDRILRLLLPNNDQKGTPPHKILALTFTKAGASEMSLRINDRLSEWAIMPLKSAENDQKQDNLVGNLRKLLGKEATPEQIEAARKLFARVVDTPGGLKIMTIHSFCQSILNRFPLEADLPPNFNAIDESQAQIFLKQAQDHVLKKAHENKGSPLSNAIHHIATEQNEDQFIDLLKNLMSERRQAQNILEQNFGVDGLYTALCQEFKIPAGKSKEEIILEACSNTSFNEQELRNACTALASGSEKTDIPRGINIQIWLDADTQIRAKTYENYKNCFLKKSDGNILKTLATKKVINANPDIIEALQNEAERIFTLENSLKSIKTATITRDLFLIGEEILAHYNALKAKESALDFDDLILRTLDLLQGRTKNLNDLEVAPWIRFKLDQGIDHILVDEAQDTNPEQWEIIKALCDDFFDGNTERNIERTIFVVGDKKQSIFSFQRASPEKFKSMKNWFENKITHSNKKFNSINFETSFRSVKSVLELVDSIFKNPDIRKGLDENELQHHAYRYTQPGLVELWPLFEDPKNVEYDPWAPPIEVIESSSGAAQMADHIGKTIENWIKTEEILESHDRPIRAGDIMILVRSRTAFLDQLVRALKTRNVPVSGVDRMILSEQLVVQDLCAAAQFALLPEDDLNLAGFLKSPFIGWNEEALFKVAHNRQGTLWQSIKNSNNPNIIQFLSGLIKNSGKDKPYEFFAKILQEKCPANSISGLHAIKSRLGNEALDPLDEFLNISLSFETDNIPTLQNFIQAQSHNESQIKRQMESNEDAVRIITVHGAKGLQAPIVILPDTVRTGSSSKPERILWPDRSEAKLPYFCPQSKQVPQPCSNAFSILKARQDEEYRRLLYVALTRAENRLYVGGYKASKPIIDESWYRYVEKGFRSLSHIEEIVFDDKIILRSSNQSTDNKPDRANNNDQSKKSCDVKTPDWLFKTMPEEPLPLRPLAPSKPSEQEAPTLSPLHSTNNHRFLRGNITHKLLQILPDIPIENRRNAAQKYVRQPAHGLSDKVQSSIISEIFEILEHPEFTNIFGSKSRAEVPITGLLDDKTLISGQIDRLLITETEVFIIDYKTNRPPPHDVKDVPAIYLSQMRAYANIMRQIYPNHNIRCALIWTDGARLMELSDL